MFFSAADITGMLTTLGETVTVADHTAAGRAVAAIFDGPAEVVDRGTGALVSHAPRITVLGAGQRSEVVDGVIMIAAQDGGTCELGTGSEISVAGRCYRVMHLEPERPDWHGLVTAYLEEDTGA